MLIPDLERYMGDKFQIGDVVHVWNHDLQIIDRRDDQLCFRIESGRSCWMDSLPADVLVSRRLEIL